MPKFSTTCIIPTPPHPPLLKYYFTSLSVCFNGYMSAKQTLIYAIQYFFCSVFFSSFLKLQWLRRLWPFKDSSEKRRMNRFIWTYILLLLCPHPRVFQKNPSDKQGVFKAGAKMPAISDLIAVCHDMITLTWFNLWLHSAVYSCLTEQECNAPSAANGVTHSTPILLQ